ncbi:hypothetical protein RB201_12725 [Streptomyces sp. S1A(2023)]
MSGRTDSKRFRVRRDSIPAARRHVRTVLVEWKLAGLVDDATLITSELATNVIAHARGTGDYFELGLRRRNGVLILEVTDSYQWLMPELRKPSDDRDVRPGPAHRRRARRAVGRTAAQPRKDRLGSPARPDPAPVKSPLRRPPASPPPSPFAERVRIEADPAYRARCFPGLDAAIAQRGHWRSPEVDALVRRLRSPP